VLSTQEVYQLAEQFGRAAGYAADAGYDGIHLSGANMGIIQQFLSPYYNRRNDEFRDGVRFLEEIEAAVRHHAGDIPLVTKVPAETAAPPFVRRHLTREDAVETARRLEVIGYDAVVPVDVSVYWDTSVIRGAFPERAWNEASLQSDYATVFGGPSRARAVQALNRLGAAIHPQEDAWNEQLCRAVRNEVDVPVLCEGGIRTRDHCETLLRGESDDAGDELDGGDTVPPGEQASDMVGMARPFYAEPRLPARLLAGADRALCESCNNCTIPQAASRPGRCRTPSVVRERARLEQRGAYDGQKNS
jgi:2,4-dienoyl-CoA reductase-like NADH-dependent reductase (Old Yellow Enzyme family)